MAPLTRGPERAGWDLISPNGGRAIDLSPYFRYSFCKHSVAHQIL